MAEFIILRSALGQWHWHLQAANSHIIADSGEAYPTRPGVLAVIARVKREVFQATIRDGTQPSSGLDVYR